MSEGAEGKTAGTKQAARLFKMMISDILTVLIYYLTYVLQTGYEMFSTKNVHGLKNLHS